MCVCCVKQFSGALAPDPEIKGMGLKERERDGGKGRRERERVDGIGGAPIQNPGYATDCSGIECVNTELPFCG